MTTKADFVTRTDTILQRHHLIHQRALTLEPMPRSVTLLMDTVCSEASSVKDITDIVRQDPILVGRLVHAANSPWSSPLDPVGTAEAAVIRLGTQLVLSLSVGFVVKAHMSNGLLRYSLEAGQLWRHSFLSSVAAEVIREHAQATVPAETSTAALLHDVGKIVLHEFLDGPRAVTLDAFMRNGAQLVQAELEALHVEHAEVGAAICAAWRLPETIRVAVQNHHNPQDCDTPTAHAVFLSDQLAHRIDDGRQHTPLATHAQPLRDSMTAIGIDPALFPVLAAETMTRYQHRATLHQEF